MDIIRKYLKNDAEDVSSYGLFGGWRVKYLRDMLFLVSVCGICCLGSFRVNFDGYFEIIFKEDKFFSTCCYVFILNWVDDSLQWIGNVSFWGIIFKHFFVSCRK